MRYLLVVDLQKEFALGDRGMEIYEDALCFIESKRDEYDAVVACVYINNDNPNMKRLVQWEDCRNIEQIEFEPDKAYQHSGYSIGTYPDFARNDQVDVIGFDTDACVLNACFDLFNLGCDFHILTDFVYSSGGQDYHMAGLTVMRRQFGKALI